MDNKTFDDRYNVAPIIFKDWIKGRLDIADSVIFDFGCDTGVMSLGLIHHCSPKKVIGVDINDNYMNLLFEVSNRINIKKLPENLEFYVIEPQGNFSKIISKEVDCVFSWSVFEHVSQPILKQKVVDLYKILRKGGYAFIQIAPLYYSAFGSHLNMIITAPWAHLTTQLNLFQDYVFKAEKSGVYADEDDSNFEKIKASLWSLYSTLNKITSDELIKIFTSSGFTLIDKFTSCCQDTPPASLKAVYRKEVLITEQIVGLFRKNC
ncbi:SAM-dependent methyltransferase domain-containing protein [Desulfonema limicola]|uniref:SAM-dependent methyltransferase domain-containing protein n=1 Tax=Desulfonema limicola TaxID=45656 RepID=A0A975GGM5_9BACT|nr:class I SAM-dependent methyltransferase [Desulfonema limicola]QTA80413.1 SAM-dependent methyltransferase domain-containing protein [Desulfonema limicola]